MQPTSNQSVQYWLKWLTDGPGRLSRWNHLRGRAGAEPLTIERAAQILSTLAPDIVAQLKGRID